MLDTPLGASGVPTPDSSSMSAVVRETMYQGTLYHPAAGDASAIASAIATATTVGGGWTHFARIHYNRSPLF